MEPLTVGIIDNDATSEMSAVVMSKLPPHWKFSKGSDGETREQAPVGAVIDFTKVRGEFSGDGNFDDVYPPVFTALNLGNTLMLSAAISSGNGAIDMATSYSPSWLLANARVLTNETFVQDEEYRDFAIYQILGAALTLRRRAGAYSEGVLGSGPWGGEERGGANVPREAVAVLALRVRHVAVSLKELRINSISGELAALEAIGSELDELGVGDHPERILTTQANIKITQVFEVFIKMLEKTSDMVGKKELTSIAISGAAAALLTSIGASATVVFGVCNAVFMGPDALKDVLKFSFSKFKDDA